MNQAQPEDKTEEAVSEEPYQESEEYQEPKEYQEAEEHQEPEDCLLYTSDAADE